MVRASPLTSFQSQSDIQGADEASLVRIDSSNTGDFPMVLPELDLVSEVANISDLWVS